MATMICKLTGLETNGGLGEMIQEYQKEIIKLRKENKTMALTMYWTYCKDCNHEEYDTRKLEECTDCGSSKVGHIVEHDEEPEE